MQSGRIHWLWEDVPLATVSRPFKPWIRHDFQIFGLNVETGVTNIFNAHFCWWPYLCSQRRQILVRCPTLEFVTIDGIDPQAGWHGRDGPFGR